MFSHLHRAATANQPLPDPRAGASLRITDTQRKPVSAALLAAAVFFLLLGSKNAWQHDWMVTTLCAVAMVMALLYARAIYLVRPNPISDVVLAALVWVVLAVTISKRDLVGVLWAPVLMLMLHLVARRRVSLVFDGLVLILVATHATLHHDGDTAFRLAAILIITSAFAQLYARNAEGHQQVLEEQRQHLDLMVRCAAVGAMEWSTTDDRAVPTERLAHWLGLTGAPAAPLRLLDHVSPDNRADLAEQLERLTSGHMEPHGSRQAPPQDLRFTRPDGQDVWLHAEFMALADAQGRPTKVVATFIDISRLRAAEADTLKALKRQQELSELRARFVAMTSHEFRTPLAAILSSAELLEHYGERLPADEKLQILHGVYDGVRRMTHMLDRILLINKADAQMLEFKPERTPLRPLLERMAHELESDASQRRLVLDVTPPDAAPEVDPKLLHHIMGNLMSNALKYSDPGQPVHVKAHAEPSRVTLNVTDQGIGIPPDDLPDLFEPFHRGGNVGERKGTGLGLTLVKKSVELHGGQIQVSARPGGGTHFEVVLPQGVNP